MCGPKAVPVEPSWDHTGSGLDAARPFRAEVDGTAPPCSSPDVGGLVASLEVL